MGLRYRSLFDHPGVLRLVVTGVPARLPMAAYGIGLLVLLRERYDSYVVAGAAAAACTAGSMLSGLVSGRWVQRPGFARLMVAVTMLDVLILLVLVGAVTRQADPAAVLALSAALGLLLPPASVVVRSRWSGLLPDGAALEQALFLESALDESVFLVGPVLITALGAVTSPETALLAAGAVTTGGGLGLATVAPSPAVSAMADRPGPPGHSRELTRLYVGFVGLGAVFSAIQVATFASTRIVGMPASAGVVLTCFSAVSLVASLVVGQRHKAVPLRRGLVGLGAATTLTTLVLLAAGPVSPLTLGLLLVPAACAASPSVAIGFAQATRSVAPQRPAQVFAWCGAALTTGLALGSAAAGVAAEHLGAAGALLVAVVAAGGGAVVAPGALARGADETGHSSHGPGVTADGTRT